MANGTVMKVKASEVQAGDFIPGLDNGFVIVGPEEADVSGDYNQRLGGEGFLIITFNDAEGEENYLIVNPDMKMTVERGGQI